MLAPAEIDTVMLADLGDLPLFNPEDAAEGDGREGLPANARTPGSST